MREPKRTVGLNPQMALIEKRIVLVVQIQPALFVAIVQRQLPMYRQLRFQRACQPTST